MKQHSMLRSFLKDAVESPVVMLVDNGSLRPQAVFALRDLAKKLSELLACEVEPVSLLHSHKIKSENLNGTAATIVRRRLKECVAQQNKHVVIIPAFIGPSLAITEYLPKLIAEANEEFPDISVTVADPLCGSDPENPDPRLAQILFDNVLEVALRRKPQRTTIATVDHGTPIKIVNTVRNAIARQLRGLCSGHTATEGFEVIACSMERRDGEEYQFNEPLLENITTQDGITTRCIVSMLFLLPGRHAGEGGDVAEICNGLVSEEAFESVHITRLMAEHPLLPIILKDRFEKVCEERSTRDALVRKYLHFTQSALPEIAKLPTTDWPVEFDHCFQRIVLDNVCGQSWYSVIEKPAYKNMSEQQAVDAVQICEGICSGELDLYTLNTKSLNWRDKLAK